MITQVLDVEGDDHQRGAQQGQALRPLLTPMFETLGALPLLPGWLPRAARTAMARGAVATAGRYYLRRHRSLLAERVGGRQLAQLEGLAEGSSASLAAIYGVNAFELESGHLSFRMGCTSLALTSRHSADGAPKLLYNHDFPPAFEPFLRLRRSRPSRGHQSLSVGYPTLVGAICGVNEHGLALSYNQGYATDLERSRPALFPSMIVQDCLDRCDSVPQALALIADTPVASGAIITLLDPSGDRAAVELSARARRERRCPAGDILYSFNRYLDPAMHPHEVPVGAVTTGLAPGYDVHECNFTRERRFLALDHSQPYDEARMWALMADHDGGLGDQNSICRHLDPWSETILTAIVDPRTATMRVAFGKPCQQRPITVELRATQRIAA